MEKVLCFHKDSYSPNKGEIDEHDSRTEINVHSGERRLVLKLGLPQAAVNRDLFAHTGYLHEHQTVLICMRQHL